MYITAGFFNILLKQFEHINIDVPGLFTAFKTDMNVLQSPLTKIDAGIMGQYFEQLVSKTSNHRIGLETGFVLPFSITAGVFNICRRYATVRELFAVPFDFAHITLNNVHEQITREEDDLFYFELALNHDFVKSYPVGARQWLEMQYGIGLQYAHSFSGRYVYPVLIHSVYPQEDEYDKLTEYLRCPVKFGQNKLAMIFNKDVLDLPIITPNKELLPIFEDSMKEIRCLEEERNVCTNKVRRYLLHSLSAVDLSVSFVAGRFNMSKRNFHRKLKAEDTSYQQILDDVRMELSRKYLKEKIPLTEIAFLLGFESQSAFNKFFQKYFHTTPGRFR